MKTRKIISIIGLVILVTASMSVFALCADDSDCASLWTRVVSCSASGDAVIEDDGSVKCDIATGTCVDPGPYVHDDCNAHNTQACQNGNLYDLTYACVLDDGACEVSSSTVNTPSSPSCDKCSTCSATAYSFDKSVTPSYQPYFENENTFDSDIGAYAIVPNTKMNISDINDVYYTCMNGAPVPRGSNLIVWVYDSSGDKLAMANNNIEISSSLDRSDVIGDSSKTCGTPVLNAFKMLLAFGMENTGIPNIYTFSAPDKYTVFVDLASAYCAPDTSNGYPVTQDYVCPWTGGDPGRSDICTDASGNHPDGWTPDKTIDVIVVNPEINITAPSDEPDHAMASYKKTWIINNTGLGKAIYSIASDCGGVGWNCAFDGYNEGDITAPQNMGELYSVTMDITPNATDPNPHLVGIIVTYDDGYDFASITPKVKTSYISFGNASTTTSSTSSTTLSTTTTTLSEPYVT